MKNENKKLFKGAFMLGAASFLVKALGAMYRVPLTALIGSKGIGLYQMVFPVYVVLLEFSGAGLPNALSKIISSENRNGCNNASADEYLKTSLKIFAAIGFVLSVFMAVFSKRIATLQGDADAAAAYVALSPSVFFVCLISCFRGYFQGLSNMFPTAASQVAEQVVKLILGLTFSYVFMPDIKRAAAGATLAVTISEAVAFLGVYHAYRKSAKKMKTTSLKCGRSFKTLAATVIKNVVPVSVAGVILPLSQVADSFIIINILSANFKNATSVYGLLSGVAMTVINLPVSVCYGIAVTAIPAVAAKENPHDIRKSFIACLGVTVFISSLAAIACYFLAPTVINVLFSRLSPDEKVVAVKLIKMLSAVVVLSSILQTTNAALIGMNKLISPTVGLFFGVFVKTVAEIILVKIPEVNVYGGAIALIACYFVADLVNLIIACVATNTKECYACKISRVKTNGN